jgi:hypothetical protein
VRLAVIVAGGLGLQLGACGSTPTPGEHSSGSLPAIVAPKPPLPAAKEWVSDFSQKVTIDDLSHSLESGELSALGPGSRTYVGKLKRAGLQHLYVTSWSDGSASATAFLFLDPSGARAGLRALRSFSHRYDRTARKRRDRDFTPAGLGSDSWGTESRGRAGTVEAAYEAWRRGNLMIYAGMDCTGACAFDVVRAVHSYATTIDARASRPS